MDNVIMAEVYWCFWTHLTQRLEAKKINIMIIVV